MLIYVQRIRIGESAPRGRVEELKHEELTHPREPRPFLRLPAFKSEHTVFTFSRSNNPSRRNNST